MNLSMEWAPWHSGCTGASGKAHWDTCVYWMSWRSSVKGLPEVSACLWLNWVKLGSWNVTKKQRCFFVRHIKLSTASVHTMLFNSLQLFKHELRDRRVFREAREKLRNDRLVSQFFKHFSTSNAKASSGTKIRKHVGESTTPFTWKWRGTPAVFDVPVEMPLEPADRLGSPIRL